MDLRSCLPLYGPIYMVMSLMLLTMHAQLCAAEDVDPPYFYMPTITNSSFWNLQLNASFTDSSILLNVNNTGAVGLAFTRQRFTLLRENNSSFCESASFFISFSFRIRDSYYGGDGMSLVMLGGNLNLTDYLLKISSAGFGIDYSSADAKNVGGFAVEVDTYPYNYDGDFDSLNTPHVGIDLNYSTTSVTTKRVTSVNLLDDTVKYLWIDYDGGIQLLSIFLSGENIKPESPLIRYSLNLCDILRPSACAETCQNVSSAYISIGGFCGAAYAAHEFLSFSLNTSWDSDSRYVEGEIPYTYKSETIDGELWNLYENATKSTSSITLTSSIVSQKGIAIFKNKIAVLNGSGSNCESASFQISFSLKMTSPSDFSIGDGVSFLILNSVMNVPNYVNSIGKLGSFIKSYQRPLYGVAIELDLTDNVLRFRLNLSTFAKEKLDLDELSIDLTDNIEKHVWIVHDKDTQILSLFISNENSQPGFAALSTPIDLCSLLRPKECSECQLAKTAYLIMAGTTNTDGFVTQELLRFAVNTTWESVPTGLQSPPPSIMSLPPPSLVSLPPSSPLTPPPSSPTPSPPQGGTNYVQIGAIIGGSVFLLAIIVIAALCFLSYRQNAKSLRHVRLHATNLTVPTIKGEVVDVGNGRFTRRFTLEEIFSATSNFSESLLLGKGGFGSVYVGTFSGGEMWAVKQSHQRLSKEQISTFETEVKLIAGVSHGNLVSLKGFCDEDGEQILVYELVRSGNLRELIERQTTDNKNLSLEDRIDIVTDAARGLDYLHHFENCPIIHCDVKSENILIGDNLTAKVADFGLLKIMDATKTHVSADVMGTLGYLDPEYVRTQRVSTKSDVYSFGVVLLEIVTGRRCNFVSTNEEDEDESTYESIVVWARKTWQHDKLSVFVDPLLDSNYQPSIVNKLVLLALQCTKYDSRLRPSMRDILNRLEEIKHENKALLGLVGSKYSFKEVGSESGSLVDICADLDVGIDQSVDSSFIGAPYSTRPKPK